MLKPITYERRRNYRREAETWQNDLQSRYEYLPAHDFVLLRLREQVFDR